MAILDLSTQAGRDAANQRDTTYKAAQSAGKDPYAATAMPSSSSGTSKPSSRTSSTPSGGYNSTNTPLNTPMSIPAAITQSASPSTNMPQQVNGSMYSQVPGTNWYSTNPSNPNAAKYNADGSPVATVGYGDQASGYNYSGYATQDQFNQMLQSSSNPKAVGDMMKGWADSGKFTSNSSIYSPSGGYANMPMSASQVSASPSSNMPGTINYPGAKLPGYTTNSGSGIGYTQGTGINAPEYKQGNMTQLTPSQQSAMDWINNSASGQGGISNYISTQQAKLNNAYASGDQSMINALNADMQRVGYSLNTPSQQSGQGSQYSQTPVSQTGQGTQGMPQAVQTTTGGFMPQAVTTNPYGALTPAQIQAQAAAQIASQTADRTRIADQTKAGYQTSYDRMNAATTDSRNLENFANSQLLNPFNGYSDYAQGQIARERSTTDRQNQQDLQTKLGGVDSQLADYLNSTPAEQQKIINDMTQQERTYFLQSNAQVLQAQNQQFNQNLATNQFNQQAQNQQFNQNLQTQNQTFSQQQAVKQQHIDLATTLSQQYGVPVYPTDDPMLSYSQVAGIPTVAAQKMAADAANSSFDNAVKKALAENTISKTQADIMQQAQQLAISKQNANTSAASASASAGNAAARLAWDKDPNNPDNLYKQSEIAKNNATSGNVDPKLSVDNSQYYKTQMNNSSVTKEQALAYAKNNASNMTDSDYKSLINWINDNK